MSVKHIRWFFTGVLGLVTLLAILFPAPVTLGASSTWTNGSYRFAGGTHPAALVLSVLLTILYFALMVAAPPELGGSLPGVVRRFFAFWLDFFIAMMVIGPTFGTFATIAEWRRTGIFVWMFERAAPAPTDTWSTTGGALLVFVLLLFYFAIPLVRRRPSPGSCIADYQIMPDEGQTITLGSAILRTIVGLFGVSMWPLTPFIARQRKRGKVWFDRPFSTHAAILR